MIFRVSSRDSGLPCLRDPVHPMPSKKRPARKVPAKSKAKGKSAKSRRAKEPTVKSLNASMRSVTPHLICAGAADAIEFYKRAFQAVERVRIAGRPGKLMHAMIQIGDSVIMLVDEYPEWG